MMLSLKLALCIYIMESQNLRFQKYLKVSEKFFKLSLDKKNKIIYYLHDKITGCWLVEKHTIISLTVQQYN